MLASGRSGNSFLICTHCCHVLKVTLDLLCDVLQSKPMAVETVPCFFYQPLGPASGSGSSAFNSTTHGRCSSKASDRTLSRNCSAREGCGAAMSSPLGGSSLQIWQWRKGSSLFNLCGSSDPVLNGSQTQNLRPASKLCGLLIFNDMPLPLGCASHKPVAKKHPTAPGLCNGLDQHVKQNQVSNFAF